jgi:hypothetical protein
MTSDARRTANRQNAKKSTGPRTGAGKARSAHNALKHGLSRPLPPDPQGLARQEALARVLAGEGASPEVVRAAEAAAIARSEVDRARTVRAELQASLLEVLPNRLVLEDHVRDDMRSAGAFLVEIAERLEALANLPERVDQTSAARYGRQAIGLRRLALAVPDLTAAIVIEDVQERLSGILSTDRYEQRALSRWRSALEALDELKAQVRTKTPTG